MAGDGEDRCLATSASTRLSRPRIDPVAANTSVATNITAKNSARDHSHRAKDTTVYTPDTTRVATAASQARPFTMTTLGVARM